MPPAGCLSFCVILVFALYHGFVVRLKIFPGTRRTNDVIGCGMPLEFGVEIVGILSGIRRTRCTGDVMVCLSACRGVLFVLFLRFFLVCFCILCYIIFFCGFRCFHLGDDLSWYGDLLRGGGGWLPLASSTHPRTMFVPRRSTIKAAPWSPTGGKGFYGDGLARFGARERTSMFLLFYFLILRGLSQFWILAGLTGFRSLSIHETGALRWRQQPGDGFSHRKTNQRRRFLSSVWLI